MSEYIEDRISALENRVQDNDDRITELEKFQVEIIDRLLKVGSNLSAVKDLKEKYEHFKEIYFSEVIGRLEQLEREVNKQHKGLEEKSHTDQSTEEFVKIVRCKNCKHKGQPRCPMTFSVSGYGGYDIRLIDPTCDDDYCSRGEKR